jgi:hypothetical protein
VLTLAIALFDPGGCPTGQPRLALGSGVSSRLLPGRIFPIRTSSNLSRTMPLPVTHGTHLAPPAQGNDWLTINPQINSMRQCFFFILMVLAPILAGCASSPNAAICARVPEAQMDSEFWVPRTDKSRHRMPDHKSSSDLTSVHIPEPKQAYVPEPRPNSTEWWLRENVRVGKAIVICKGCLPSTATNVSLPKPSGPTAISSTQALQ